MASNKEQQTVARGGSGIGFFGLLTILFIGLKLTGYIAWSWWWVLSPIWILAALVAFTLILLLIVAFMLQPPRNS